MPDVSIRLCLLRPATEVFTGCKQVRVVSAKLLKLQSLFGEDAELDVAAMLIKEPRLAATDIRVIARRLLEMRVSFLAPCTISLSNTRQLLYPPPVELK